MDDVIELKINKVEDRARVSAILVSNGYWVAQGKRAKGKSVEYTLKVKEDPDNLVSTTK